MGLAVKHPQVQDKHPQDKNIKDDP